MEVVGEEMHVEGTPNPASDFPIHFALDSFGISGLYKKSSLTLCKHPHETIRRFFVPLYRVVFSFLRGESQVYYLAWHVENRDIHVDWKIRHVEVVKNNFALELIVEDHIPLVEGEPQPEHYHCKTDKGA